MTAYYLLFALSLCAVAADERTPLMLAAETGDLRTATKLLDEGVDVNQAAADGITALNIAVEGGHDDVVEALLKHKADPNTRTPVASVLHSAVENRQERIAEVLIAYGARVNATDEQGRTPLHVAIQGSAGTLAAMLLLKGADANAKSYDGRSPMSIAAEMGDVNAVRELLNHGADANAQTDTGMTLLGQAASAGAEALADALIAKGADVNAASDTGETPLALAAANGHTKMVELLKRAGAKE